MHVLDRRGLPLPEIVIVERASEIPAVKEAGLPYVVRPGKMSDERILKTLLFGVLTKMFPWVNWGRLGTSAKDVVLVAPKKILVPYAEDELLRAGGGDNHFSRIASDIEEQDVLIDQGEEYRESYGEGYETTDDFMEYGQVSMETLYDEGALTINAQELMDAGLLPKWLMDIGESIRANLASYYYNDCWNRKLGAYLGEYSMNEERPNLIVLDVSGSIPAGISYTMVGLIQTLCAQNNADLIINSGVSQWWPHNQPLDVDEISNVIGGCNEAEMFYRILEEHVLGKKWGNVIGFGDMDAPINHVYTGLHAEIVPSKDLFARTEIGCAIGYHTGRYELPGYLRWVEDCNTQEIKKMGSDWCKQVRRWPYDTGARR